MLSHYLSVTNYNLYDEIVKLLIYHPKIDLYAKIVLIHSFYDNISFSFV